MLCSAGSREARFPEANPFACFVLLLEGEEVDLLCILLLFVGMR